VHVAKNIFIPYLKILLEDLQLLVQNKHWTSNNISIPRILNDLFTIFMQSPHVEEFKLVFEGGLGVFKMKKDGKMVRSQLG
jgi:hypothetical protein